MGTKRTKKEEAPAPVAKLAPKRKMATRPPAEAPAKVKPAAKAPAKPAAKPAVKATRKAPAGVAVVETVAVTAVTAPVEIPTEVIALRAYYISEARQAAGLPGDSTTDWLEAERQIRAEL